MKKTKFLTGLLFNTLMSVLFAAILGINPLLAFGGMAAGSTLLPKAQGTANMAIQKEIWMSTLVENLFANNSFISKAFNADMFVTQGKTVHIPNAGNPSGVKKNRKSFPATVETRTDVDLSFDLDEFTTDPIKIPNADTYELSYNKRESVLKNDKSKLMEEVANSFVYYWSPTVADAKLRTSGDAVTAHLPSATGNRKAFDKADVKKAMTLFNKQNIPQEGRYLLVDADMFDQLLDSLTAKEIDVFNNLANISEGTVGKLYTFNIMMRSKAGRYTTGLNRKAWTNDDGGEVAGAATDHGAAIAWHENSVCRALGAVDAFEEEDSPTHYGDIYSFLARAGGRPMRSDVEGLAAIIQDTSS